MRAPIYCKFCYSFLSDSALRKIPYCLVVIYKCPDCGHAGIYRMQDMRLLAESLQLKIIPDVTYHRAYKRMAQNRDDLLVSLQNALAAKDAILQQFINGFVDDLRSDVEEIKGELRAVAYAEQAVIINEE